MENQSVHLTLQVDETQIPNSPSPAVVGSSQSLCSAFQLAFCPCSLGNARVSLGFRGQMHTGDHLSVLCPLQEFLSQCPAAPVSDTPIQ